jgi:tRNA1(Val) A37 N6-methylase TrmN6
MFGGKAQIGLRGDINAEVYPDVVADAHYTPFKDNYFDVVICDPPYNNDYNKKLYSIDIPLKLNKWVREAVRILKPLGYLVMYHLLWIPRPQNTSYYKRIVVLPGQNHQARICHIFQKEGKRIPEWLT